LLNTCLAYQYNISPQVTADDATFKSLGTSLRVPLRIACLTLISVKSYKADLTIIKQCKLTP